MENTQQETQKTEPSIKDLTKSIALLPDFIIDPLKDYIREEISYGVSVEVERIVQKKIAPEQKKLSVQHLLIMFLLVGLLVILVLDRFL